MKIKGLIIGIILLLLITLPVVFILRPQLFIDIGNFFNGSNNKQVSDKVIQTYNEPVGYTDYNTKSFSVYQENKRILYFHADWCPICKTLDSELTNSQQNIPTDVVIYKVNYDTEEELKNQYAITYQHTFVQVDKFGNEIAKWSGGDLETILKNIK